MPKAKGFFAGSKIQKAAPGRTLPQCGGCGLYRKCTNPKLPVHGEGRLRVLIVGDAPSGEDDAQGQPCMDKLGVRLRRVLKAMRYDLDQDVWFTYAARCHTPKSRVPTSAEVAACRPNVTKAIKELEPHVIVPMGASAISSVLGPIWGGDVGPADRWAGWRIPCQQLNAWVCPTWHPRTLVHKDDQVMDRQFRDHLAAALGTTGRPWPTGCPDWGRQARLLVDTEVAARWLRKCRTRQDGAIAWDYETNMLKPDGPDARIVSCAVAWGREDVERCIAFPWHGEAITAMGELLRSPVPKIASNLKFEDRWTRQAFGHRVRAWVWDTMLAAHVLDNRSWITSVKFQAFVRLGVPCWNDKIEPFLKTKGDDRINAILREIDISDLLKYNGLDALLEFKVAIHQMKEMGYATPWKI